MRLEPEYPTWCGSECDTMAQLISSAIQLGVGVARAAASVLSARFIRDPGDEDDPPFLAFAILLLATYAECGVGEDRGPLLKQLATWVESEESRARTERSEPEWLFGLNRYTGRERVWRSLAERILMHPERPHPREANSALRRLAEFAAGRQDRAETETQ